MSLSQDEKKKAVNGFRHAFERALPEAARDISADFPHLSVDETVGISCLKRFFNTEVTDSYRILIDHRCSDEEDFVHHQSFWPYFDDKNTVRYTLDPDSPGFSDPSEMARFCIQDFVKQSSLTNDSH